MRKLMWVVVVAVGLVGGAGCEDKKAATDEVGGAAKAQLDAVQERANAAAAQAKAQADEAAAAAKDEAKDEGGW